MARSQSSVPLRPCLWASQAADTAARSRRSPAACGAALAPSSSKACSDRSLAKGSASYAKGTPKRVRHMLQGYFYSTVTNLCEPLIFLATSSQDV